jgi:hypothetical protein
MTERILNWKNGSTFDNDVSEPIISESRADIIQRSVESGVEKMSRQQRQELVGTMESYATSNGLTVEDTPIPLIHVPIFQDKDSINIQSADITRVNNALLKIENLAFSDKPLGKELLRDVSQGMFPEGSALMLGAKNVNIQTAMNRNIRFDTFRTIQGQMWMIEANTVAPEGIHYHDILINSSQKFLNQLAIDIPEVGNQTYQTASHSVFNMLLTEYIQRKNKLPNTLGIIFENEGEDNVINRTELPYLATSFEQYARQNGFSLEVLLGRPTEIAACNGMIELNGKKVDILWRNNLDPEGYFKKYNNGGREEVSGIFEVIQNPNIYPIVNDERARFAGYKETMAYLHNPILQQAAGLLDDEIQAIHNIVPFTFDPSDETIIELRGKQFSSKEILMNYAEHFVLKPKVGTHGQGVVFGANKDEKEWGDAVNDAINGGHMIAQQYIPYSQIKYNTLVISKDGTIHYEDYYMDTNMHVIGGSAKGSSICRSSPVSRFGNQLGVLNVAAGGGLRASFRV